MGIKLILTENQLRTLDEQLSQEMREGSANLSCTDINYHELDQYLGNKNDRKIGFETIVHRVDDYEIAIRHYRTNILVVDATNIVTINTNGWTTKTTKDRLNQFLKEVVIVFFCKIMSMFYKNTLNMIFMIKKMFRQ